MAKAGISVHQWKALAEYIASEQDVIDVWRELTSMAKGRDVDVYGKDGEVVGTRRESDVQAIKLYLSYTVGAPKRGDASGIISVDPDKLKTPDDCIAAASAIMREQMAGRLDAESAAALRATVDLALKAHVAKRGDGEAPEAPQINVNVQTYERPKTAGGVEE